MTSLLRRWGLWLGMVVAGGSGEATGPNRAPVAEAGPDRVAVLGAPLELDGSQSRDPDGDALTFEWRLLAAPAGSASPAGQLSAAPGAAKAVLTPDAAGAWMVGLVVSDGRLRSAMDVVVISAAPGCSRDQDCPGWDSYCAPMSCENGSCVAHPVDCDDGDICTNDSCDEAGRTCRHTPRTDLPPEGPPGDTTCSNQTDDDCDGLTDNLDPGCRSCTEATQATDCDDDNACTDDVCVNEICENRADDGNACDDGSACSTDDHCASGVCVGNTACDDGNACTDDVCDAQAGCGHNADDSNACSDGSACSSDDHCESGTCVGNTACNDNNPCTVDTCEPQTGCVFPAVGDGTDCDDGSMCTDADHCQGGQCVGTAVACDDGNACTDDTCDPVNRCVYTDDDSNTCDDQNACSEGDRCSGGNCIGDPLDGDDDGYVSAACGGQDCDDADGAINPGATEGPFGQASCGDNVDNDCDGQTDTADMGCKQCQSDADCDDHNACNGVETCDGTLCHAGTPPNCNDGNVCTDDGCDAQTGCTHVNNGNSCNDGNACTISDTCSGGACVGQTRNCDDGNVCTDDGCDPATGCTHQNNTASCNDNNACTVNDRCSGGICGGDTRNCDDSNVCTSDSCDPGSGCVNTNNTAPCNDGIWCNGTDTCGGGVCNHSGDPCQSGDVCNSTCNEGNPGNCYSPPSTDCSDNNACTSSDHCLNGSCVGTTVDCDDHNVCTNDSCDPASGCLNANNTLPCDDGSWCNGTDTCGGGVCNHSGDPCLAGDECNNTCNEGNPGNCYSPDTTVCNDGHFCTATDRCDGNGTCVGTGDPCAGNPPCHNVCHESPDTCDANPGESCDDGYNCTDNDTCNTGLHCVGVQQDSLCPTSGQVCQPGCFDPPTGCGFPPQSLTVSCPNSWDLSDQGEEVPCTLDLADAQGGMTGQAACLACIPEIGMVTVDVTTFGDPNSGACDMNGWEVVAGQVCRGSASTCTQGGGYNNCATSNICVFSNNNWLMRSDQQQNDNGYEEWRLRKTFDLSNLTDSEVCFYSAGNNLGGNDALIIYAEDGQNSQQIFCQNGLVRPGANNVAFPWCATLPPWANDNPAVTITILAHSEDNGHILYLDNIVLHGWPTQCAPNSVEYFTEDFNDCPSPLPSNWNDWTVAGTINCNSASTCYAGNRAFMSMGVASLTRTVDTRSLDGNIHLCFYPGELNANNASDGMLVEYSVDGSIWSPAWIFVNNFGDTLCGEICVNLSDLDRRVARNPNLGIRFIMFSDNAGNVINLDYIRLTGSRWCSGSGIVDAYQFTEDSQGTQGRYDFTTRDQAGNQLYTELQCIWDAYPSVRGLAGITFRP